MDHDEGLYPATPSPAALPSSGPDESARYGRVGRVPWTFGQTLLGAGVTVVPWLLLVSLSNVLTVSTSSIATRHKLNPAADILGGIVFLLFTALVEGAFLLAPFIIAMRSSTPGSSRSSALRALGLRATQFWPAAAWVILGLMIVYLVTILYGAFITRFHLPLQTNGETLVQEAQTMPFTVLGALIGAVLIAPFCEEIFFRGFFFAGLLRGMNVVWAALLSAAVFTLVHGDLGSAVPLFAIGLMLAVIRWRTGSVWPCVALHMLNNAVAAVAVVGTFLDIAGRATG